jgi:hypothetical protein
MEKSGLHVFSCRCKFFPVFVASIYHFPFPFLRIAVACGVELVLARSFSVLILVHQCS